ncbi:hypothetical protein H671_2g7141 [Cricetulus griseus]|uniref:Uncharacterized protein n=1 Tax=Cricetulus griseus TaxID=10029 RepID=A0A061IFT3_CRIGR|nr:hypothetical protein H671_2g7141 [Cricetulus griseus]
MQAPSCNGECRDGSLQSAMLANEYVDWFCDTLFSKIVHSQQLEAACVTTLVSIATYNVHCGIDIWFLLQFSALSFKAFKQEKYCHKEPRLDHKLGL